MRGRYRPESQTKAIAVQDARAQLAALLVSARTIDHFTADDLSRRYRVPAKEVSARLEHERQRRSRLL